MRYFSHIPNPETGERHTINNPPFVFGQEEYLVEEISETEFKRRNTPGESSKWIIYNSSRSESHAAAMRYIIVNPDFNKPNLILLL